MVNIVSCYMSFRHKMVKLAGLKPIKVEIQPGTIINFWVSSSSNSHHYDHHDNHNDNKENKKKKQALVLIHGFAGDGILTWQFQVLFSSLGKKYAIYIPDLLFFGGSHTDQAERSPRFQADCLAKGLRKVGVKDKCMVVGFSYGGFVGLEMAEHHPDLVGSMVVTGSFLALSETVSSKSLDRIGFTSWPDYLMPTSVDGVKVMLDIGSHKLPRLPKLFYKHCLEIMFNNRKERVELLDALVIRDEDVTNHQFQQTIHLLWGNEDKIFNMEVANNLKERLGGTSKLQVINKAGHLAVLERPFAFNKCLKKMLSSLAAEQRIPS